MQENNKSWGIDLTGRTMWYEPWPVDSDNKYTAPDEKAIEEIYGISGEAVRETLLYFEERADVELKEKGGAKSATKELVDMLNAHIIDEHFTITRDVLLDASRWYNNEYYFYFVMFTKKVMGRYDFHFGEGSDEQLSVYHKIYEKGFLELEPFGGNEKGVKNFIPYAFSKYYEEKGYNLEKFYNWLDILAIYKTKISYKNEIRNKQHYWLSLEFIALVYEIAKVLINTDSWVEIGKEASKSLKMMQFSFVPKRFLIKSIEYIFNSATNVYETEVKLKGREVYSQLVFKECEVVKYGKYQKASLKAAYQVTIGGFSYIYI